MVDIEIRLATLDDAKELFTMLVQIQDEFPVKSINPGKAYNMVRTVIKEGVVFLAIIDGEIVGSLGLMAAPWWFSDEIFLRDFWTVVKKARRNTRAITLLFEAAMAFSDETNVPLVLGLFSDQKRRLKSRLYRQRFKPIGEFFTYGM